MRGHRSKSKLLCGVAAGALVSALSTPGTAQAQSVDWRGFYVGIYAGGAWGDSNASTGTTCPAMMWAGAMTGGYYCSSSSAATLPNAAAVTAAGSGSASSSAFVGGAQAGYNWQAGRFVYGVEADFGSFSLDASRQGSGVYPVNGGFPIPIFLAGKNFTVASSISTDWLFTARGRVGWTVDNWLLFATGGLAVTNLETSLNFSDTNASGAFSGAIGSGSNVLTKLGWTVGVGAQYAVNKNWSLKAEYLYVSFGSINTSALVTHGAFVGYSNLLSTSQDLTVQIARAGINYRF